MYGGTPVNESHPVDVEQYLDLFDGAAIDMQLSSSIRKEHIISEYNRSLIIIIINL